VSTPCRRVVVAFGAKCQHSSRHLSEEEEAQDRSRNRTQFGDEQGPDDPGQGESQYQKQGGQKAVLKGFSDQQVVRIPCTSEKWRNERIPVRARARRAKSLHEIGKFCVAQRARSTVGSGIIPVVPARRPGGRIVAARSSQSAGPQNIIQGPAWRRLARQLPWPASIARASAEKPLPDIRGPTAIALRESEASRQTRLTNRSAKLHPSEARTRGQHRLTKSTRKEEHRVRCVDAAEVPGVEKLGGPSRHQAGDNKSQGTPVNPSNANTGNLSRRIPSRW